MDLEQYRGDIEALKTSVTVSARLGVAREHTLIQGVRSMRTFYENDPKEEYLLGALLQIQAYLEIGFTYRSHADLFDDILGRMNLTRQDVFPKRFYAATRVKLNKSQVRSMIRRWSGAPQNIMKITQVVEDILDKVKRQEQGVHYYVNHTAGVEPDVYELVIQEEECFFHDLKWERYYVFADIPQQ